MRSKYGLIVVWGGVVSSVFIGAFFLKFGSWPVSDSPSDWADFGTYLSGTVGVTAVLGTLVAFVVTLRQQKELLESQKQMLIDQKRQIDISENQLIEAKRKDQRDEAYANMRDILPLMLKGFDRSLSLPFEPSDGGAVKTLLDNVVGEEGNRYQLRNVVKKISRIYPLLASPNVFDYDKEELKSYFSEIFGNSRYLAVFVVDNVKVNPGLFYVADSLLSERLEGDVLNYWQYIELFLAFDSGLRSDSQNESYFTSIEQTRNYLHIEDPNLKCLYQIGCLLKG